MKNNYRVNEKELMAAENIIFVDIKLSLSNIDADNFVNSIRFVLLPEDQLQQTTKDAFLIKIIF